MKLVINKKKTKILHIHSPHFPLYPIQIITHSQSCLHANSPIHVPCQCKDILETVNEYKYLGVTIDSRFKFDRHIDLLNKKLRTCSYIIFQLKNFLNTATLRIVYCAFVEPLVRYGLMSWGNTSQCFLESVTLQQKRILKAMCSRKFSNHIQYFNAFNVLPAHSLFQYILILKYYFSDSYKIKENHNHDTRNSNLYIEPRFTNEYGRQLLEHTVPMIFNKLPGSLKNLTKISEVKKNVRKWLLTEH